MSTAPIYPSDDWQRRHMGELGARIKQWKREYYYQQPTVDDATFDLHWHNLLWLESRYPHLKHDDSPTNGVGAELAG